ncbi:FkbM family methyltransferase [Poseidonocella sp. HB161398]|uniref:FkbM family methyltransferase n=1 Tax=Poseidonocella sp. HB161398 TaxID=2320855 RepID=UPI001108532F|nr:FkbM family methyltransferase [Poseidonocella sp. HB161398]
MAMKQRFGQYLREQHPRLWKAACVMRHGDLPAPAAEGPGGKAAAETAPRVSQATFLPALKMSPDYVLDVGVATGSPDLYKAFPASRLVLIDPQRGFETRLKYRPENPIIINKAIGAAEGEMVLHARLGHSSLHERTELTAKGETRDYKVEITTLDSVIDTLPPATSVGIKLDIEGHELEAIKGLERHLGRVQFIACEVSVMNRFVDGYTFADVVGLLDKKGFRLYAILNSPHPQRPLRFLDCLFLHRDAPQFG